MPAADPGVAAALARVGAAGIAGPVACAVVTGTGLGELAGLLEARVSLPYAAIPGFPGIGVSGHGGALHRGLIADRPVLVFEGRAHAYERGDAAAMRLPLGVAAGLGAECLLLTNAAGSLARAAPPGALVALSDHINLSGLNPLIGEPTDARFVPMTEAYDPALRAALARAARDCDLPLTEAVYAWFSGPSFETPAEIRMAGRLGADLVGMSTVPEVILARFLGLRVAALSVVTNYAAGFAAGDARGDPHHAETKAVAQRAASDLARLVRAFVAALPATRSSQDPPRTTP